MAITRAITRYTSNADADFLAYTGRISNEGVDKYIEVARGVQSKPNLFLALSTYGGDPNAAFRMASFNRRRYGTVTLLVPGYCKSAGTLIAFGADQIVMSELGEFGPLDMQVIRRDDLLHYGSGLDITQAVLQTSQLGSIVFGNFFRAVLARGEGAISTKTAAAVASEVSIGLMTPIISQIDPLQLGEVTRVNTTATAYAKRLRPQDGEAIVGKLIHGYPSHGYCIDVDEAMELFGNVSQPEEGDETTIFDVLEGMFRTPLNDVTVLNMLEVSWEVTENDEEEDSDNKSGEPAPRTTSENGESGDSKEVRNIHAARGGKASRSRSAKT